MMLLHIGALIGINLCLLALQLAQANWWWVTAHASISATLGLLAWSYVVDP